MTETNAAPSLGPAPSLVPAPPEALPASIQFAYVDVFAAAPLTGAPLSVVTDATGLDESQLRAIAREFNQSETTFILKDSGLGGTRRLRSFTPTGEEVLGAGHNALGAWIWLAGSGQLPIDHGTGEFTQQIGDELLPVQVRRQDGQVVVAMRQSEPAFGAVVSDRTALARALGLDPADLVAERDAQVVSTGAGHLLVAARSRAVVDKAMPDAEKLVAVLAQVAGEGCYLYTDDTLDPDATAYARFFNPAMGIWEDPATGTAAGPLAAKLVADGLIATGSNGEATVVVEQGHSMGRPSTLTVTVSGKEIRLNGGGLVVARGELTLRPAAPHRFSAEEERFLRRAITIAVRSRADGDAPFGSVLVGPDGQILSEERNTVRSDNDITAHPELKLARWAARELAPDLAAGTTLFTSCQPCEMCTGAIARSGLGRVLYALSNEQLTAVKSGGGFPRVPQLGPALTAEALAAVTGYYD